MIEKSFRNKTEDGFTLVELLVVILIIGILAAVAIPAFMEQRQRANETSLQSDLKNAASTVIGWQASGETWQEMRERINRARGSFLVKSDDLGPSSLDSFGPSTFWNNHDLPKISVSPGVWIEIVSFQDGSETNSATWHTGHDAQEFCIIGSHENSSYDFHRGTHGESDYDKLLYYDQKLGGVVEIEDIIQAVESDGAESAACYAYAERYLAAS